jgi:hypothetical protein
VSLEWVDVELGFTMPIRGRVGVAMAAMQRDKRTKKRGLSAIMAGSVKRMWFRKKVCLGMLA